MRCTVGGNDGDLVRNAKLFADSDRAHHGRQVRVAAHNNANFDRSWRLWSGHVFKV